MHQALVEYAPGFSGVGGGGVPPSDFLRKSWQILEPVANFWESSAGNSGFLHHQTDHSQVHQSRLENGVM